MRPKENRVNTITSARVLLEGSKHIPNRRRHHIIFIEGVEGFESRLLGDESAPQIPPQVLILLLSLTPLAKRIRLIKHPPSTFLVEFFAEPKKSLKIVPFKQSNQLWVETPQKVANKRGGHRNQRDGLLKIRVHKETKRLTIAKEYGEEKLLTEGNEHYSRQETGYEEAPTDFPNNAGHCTQTKDL
jgi:hypothetical protein